MLSFGHIGDDDDDDDDDNNDEDDDDDDDDTVSIKVVEDGHASLVAFSRVRLCSAASEIKTQFKYWISSLFQF